jgi:hypothetical protein
MLDAIRLKAIIETFFNEAGNMADIDEDIC